MKTIAERLKDARERLGLSQQALAKKAGVSQGTIGNIEAGIRESPRELLAIAAAAKVSPTWLKSGKGPREAGDSSPVVDPKVDDTDLGQLVADWPFIPPEQRRRILDSVREPAAEAKRHLQQLLEEQFKRKSKS